jgi:hypothetical protein
VTFLARQEHLLYSDQFVMRQQVRLILKLLGSTKSRDHKIVVYNTIEILKGRWPFKVFRIRMLINECEAQ